MLFYARDEAPPEIPAEWAGKNRLAGTDMVTLNVRNLPLAEVAQQLSKIYKEPLAIPAERALAPIKLSKKDTALADVISELGLITMSTRSRSRAKSK